MIFLEPPPDPNPPRVVPVTRCQDVGQVLRVHLELEVGYYPSDIWLLQPLRWSSPQVITGQGSRTKTQVEPERIVYKILYPPMIKEGSQLQTS